MALKIKSISGIEDIVVSFADSANNVPATGIVGLETSGNITAIVKDNKLILSGENTDLSDYYNVEKINELLDEKQDILNFEYNDNDAISAINGSALAIPEIDLSNYYTKTETSGKEELSAEFNTKQDIIANKKDSSIPYLETINSEPSWEVIESSHINAHGTAEEGELYDIPINGRTYKVVCINGKLWLAENYVNEAKATYTHPKYGSYFNKATINSVTFVPQGWHIPSKEEWQSLIDYTENHEKYLSTTDWHQGTNYAIGTNELKLNILPGSEYNPGRQEISSEYYQARFWTSTDEILSQSTGKQRVYAKISNYIGYNSKIISFDWDGPGSLYYFPVRLIKDDLEVPAPDGWKKFNGKNFMAIADDEGNTFKDFYLKTSAAQQLYQVKGDYASSADVTVLNTYYGLTTTGWKDISTNYYDKQSVDNMIAGIDLSNYYTKSETSGKTELTNAFNNKMNLFQAGTDLIFLNGKLGVHTDGYIGNSNYAFVEGKGTSALGAYTHAEGQCTVATNNNGHSEGYYTSALHQQAHTEGSYTIADGSNAHAEGTNAYAHGHDSHAEGAFTTANNFYAHAEGDHSIANATASHAEGYYTSAIGNYSHSEGYQTSAVGEYSHAEGHKTSASGNDAHAEGNTTYSVAAAHAEGYKTSAMTVYTHAEGENTVAASTAAHSEGSFTSANGKYSHTEGGKTVANGLASHAEGSATSALADCSHAEGSNTSISSGASAAHTEGSATSANGKYAHAEGVKSVAISIASHAEGSATSAIASYSHTEGCETYANGSFGSHAQGYRTSANGSYSFAGGCYTLANYSCETVLGKYNLLERTDSPLFVIGNGANTANRSDAFIVGSNGVASATNLQTSAGNVVATNSIPTANQVLSYNGTNVVWTDSQGGGGGAELTAGTDLRISNGIISVDTTSTAVGAEAFAVGTSSYASDYGATFACGEQTSAIGYASHTEGFATIANLDCAHAEGQMTSALGQESHAEGWKTIAGENGDTHAEGSESQAIGWCSHAEGNSTLASGSESHTEGTETSAIGWCSHAEGYETFANNECTHAEGYATSALGDTSHVEGWVTIANDTCMHVQGKYNKTSANAAFVIGNGTEDNDVVTRSDAFIVDWNGVASAVNLKTSAGQVMTEPTLTAGKQYSYTTTGWHEFTLPEVPTISAENGITATTGTGADAGKIIVGIDTTNYKLLTTAEYNDLVTISGIVAANSARWVLTPAS